MNKTDKIKEQYLSDTETMASKSRFGYFSLLPSHTAAHNEFPSSPSHKDSDGKVQTKPRNIYSGPTSTGSLRKNNFSYVPSPFHGSAYEDPGKNERKLQLEMSKQWQGKQVFKPIKLNKTLMGASYPYMSPYDPKKDKKDHRNAQGKVITESPNVLISPQSKIHYASMKQFKYTECPPAQRKETVKLQVEKIEPFKAGNPQKQIFTSNYQTYFDSEIKKKDKKPALNKSASHQGPFKPSCIGNVDTFTPIVYTQEGTGKPKVGIKKKRENKGIQPFKLTKVQHNTKPCPSVSLTKVNLLRICR